MWKLLYGEIEADMMILHKCNNKICANPNHLYEGTALENIMDFYHGHPDFDPFAITIRFQCAAT